MSSEARLYSFSPETKQALLKFRLSTSRSTSPQALIYSIDKTSHEILRDPKSSEKPYTNLQDLAEDLPENSPRFALLSHPVTLGDGRKSAPYVLVFWMPVNVNAELRMLYAGAKELVRNTAEVGKVMEAAEEEDILELGDLLAKA